MLTTFHLYSNGRPAVQLFARSRTGPDRATGGEWGGSGGRVIREQSHDAFRALRPFTVSWSCFFHARRPSRLPASLDLDLDGTPHAERVVFRVSAIGFGFLVRSLLRPVNGGALSNSNGTGSQKRARPVHYSHALLRANYV